MPRATSSVWTEKSTAWTETGDDRGGTAPAWLSVPMTDPSMLTDSDRGHLRRCVELAQAALEAGDEPFGSVLVDEHGTERFADRNRAAGGDATRHPARLGRTGQDRVRQQQRAVVGLAAGLGHPGGTGGPAAGRPVGPRRRPGPAAERAGASAPRSCPRGRLSCPWGPLTMTSTTGRG